MTLFGRLLLHVCRHQRGVREPLARGPHGLLGAIDAGHEGAEADQRGGLPPGSRAEVENVPALEVRQPLTHRLRQAAPSAAPPEAAVCLVPRTQVGVGLLPAEPVTSVWPRTTPRRGREADRLCHVAGLDEPACRSVSEPVRDHLLRLEVVERPTPTTPAETALTLIPRGASSTAR